MDETHPGARKLAQAGQGYLAALVGNDRSNGRQIALSGGVGCGKTRVARRIYSFASGWGVDIMLRHGKTDWRCFWVDFPAIVEVDDNEEFESACYELQLCAFVVVDDIGSESDRFKNGLAASRLRRVLTLIENKWAVITTNLTEASAVALYDLRAADRLRAMQWVEVGAVPSYRPKLKG